MILESITLKNYRQYMDNKILFALPKDGKNFTIIQGANGSGKSNLLNAITWCLYGIEKHLKEKYRGLPIISTTTYEKMNPGDIEQVFVEILMLDEDHKKIILKRILNFRKSGDGMIKSIPDTLSTFPDGSKFEILRQIKEEMVLVESPIYVLNRLIPESLEEYFFFDGERLNDYFMENSGEKIKAEVFKISQLNLLETTIEHLKNKKNEYLKDSSKLNSKAEGIGEKIEVLRHSLEINEDLLKKTVQDKDDAERKEKEYDGYLRNSGKSEVDVLQKKRDELKGRLDIIDTDLETEYGSKFDYLIKETSNIYLYDAMFKTSQMISEKEDSGDIPSDYKRNFIEKLLKKGRCICGTDISNDSEFREKIIVFLEKSERISDISEELIRNEANLKSLMDDITKFKINLETYNKKIRRFEDQKKTIIDETLEISEKLTHFGDAGEIEFWEKKRFEYERLKNELLIKIGGIKEQNKNAKKEIENLENNLNKELEKEEKYEEIQKILIFCDQSYNKLLRIKNEIMEDFRKELEEKTKQQFFGLIWKKQNYNNIIINEEYELSVTHKSGLEGIDTLSAGERQVLALSFVAALNRVSGFDIPIVIDTPLGRISKIPKINIAKNLPNYLEGKQVILLVTEEEYSDEVRDRLFEKTGKEYRIDFNEDSDSGIARVIPYGK